MLLGKGAGYDEVAAEFGLTIDPRIDLNFIEMPLAGSVLDVATRSTQEVCCADSERLGVWASQTHVPVS